MLYLASKSPRRRELLRGLGFDVHVLANPNEPRGYMPDDEVQRDNEAPADYVRRTATEKYLAGLAAVRALQDADSVHFDATAPMIAADTVVTCDGRVLGKPKDAEEATAFLRALSNRTHEVSTAVAVGFSPETMRMTVSTSLVTMRAISDGEMAAYIATGEPYDKAGGYGIQGLAGIFIAKIEGSYTGIMGLPVFETAALLASLGVKPPFCGA